MDLFGIAASHFTRRHHSGVAATQFGKTGHAAIVEPVVVDLLLLAFHADDDRPGLMVVGGSAAIGQPRNHEDGQVVIGLLVEKVDTEALLHVTLAKFGAKPSG